MIQYCIKTQIINKIMIPYKFIKIVIKIIKLKQIVKKLIKINKIMIKYSILYKVYYNISNKVIYKTNQNYKSNKTNLDNKKFNNFKNL